MAAKKPPLNEVLDSLVPRPSSPSILLIINFRGRKKE